MDDLEPLTHTMRVRLKAMRKKSGLTGPSVAARLGINKSNIPAWESLKNLDSNPRRQRIRREHIRQLAALWNCSEEYLLCKSDDPIRNQVSVLDAGRKEKVQEAFNAPEGQKAPSDKHLQHSIKLEPRFPEEQHKFDFKNANELWITGTNLRRIVADSGGYLFERVKDVLKRGKLVKVLMHHPKDEKACRYGNMQDPGAAPNFDDYVNLVGNNLDKLNRVRNDPKGNGKNLSLRTMDYMFAFGLDIMNLKMDEHDSIVMEEEKDYDWKKGIVYVRFYPLSQKRLHSDDRPSLRLTHSDDPFWYYFFIKQFEFHWAADPRKGWAKDLPLNYTWKQRAHRSSAIPDDNA